MKFLSGVIAICSTFWMHIYLYGLEATSSLEFKASFYLNAIILFLLGVYCYSDVF
ncbi:hypothetical protein JTF06_02780 [Desemzia sp. RIT804]|uniref:hypothetical protein n=1 Tax=Desemzia sp. RIT 804 TaxID=2810209 RepID=UPI00194DDED6|nr:hypothetical protein [Desemzia sp. RIT 804]MBM6613818.1 hypothetical protein [Desemzia sp. RIT 804]